MPADPLSTGGMPRPVPEPTPATVSYWEALDREELSIPRCRSCGGWVFYPRPRCPTCLSADLDWQTVEPVGEVYAYSVSRRPTAPMFADDVPQVIAVVELEIGVRMTTTLVVHDLDQLRVGLPVVGVFDHVEPGVTLLRFRPVV